jgi:hypothetical protein
MTADGAHRLLVVLEAEETLYRELRDLLQRERELVIDLDGPALEALVRRKESLAAEGQLLEESRLDVVRELARELGLATERPGLSELAARLADAAPLRSAHARLAALVASVRELLDANAVLAGDALSRVRGTLRVLGRFEPGASLYGPAVAPALAAASGRLLSRTA